MTDPTPTENPYLVAQPMSASDERLWATLVHVGGIVASFIGLPFLPALIGYLVFKDRGPFIRAHSATALNFQLTMLIVYLVGFILTILLIGIFVIIAAGIVGLVFSILAAVAANRGQYYVYPLAIPFVK